MTKGSVEGSVERHLCEKGVGWSESDPTKNGEGPGGPGYQTMSVCGLFRRTLNLSSPLLISLPLTFLVIPCLHRLLYPRFEVSLPLSRRRRLRVSYVSGTV